MWAIYWRSIFAIVLVILILSYCHQQFGILNLASNSSYYPSLFWCLSALLFCLITVIQRKGLIYLFWGKRLAFNNSIWRILNIGTILFFIGLAILSLVIYASLSNELWSKYKLYVQPVAIIIWPLLLGNYLLYRIKT
ncbi:septation protein IspZ [Thalassotalea aquiviva]|uniref:septation protein IspZ n=1 Tax=Thalassotalea aquiviva TaxID=3242415 RepID=UPI00352BADE2